MNLIRSSCALSGYYMSITVTLAEEIKPSHGQSGSEQVGAIGITREYVIHNTVHPALAQHHAQNANQNTPSKFI